jgi:hypothetical protein
MIFGYYILPLAVFHGASTAEPVEACAHQIDDTYVICWARFRDHGHEARWLAQSGVEALPDVRQRRALDPQHVAMLQKYGVAANDTTADVSDKLAAIAGNCMKLPG